MIRQYQTYMPPGNVLSSMWDYDDIDDAVHTEVDNKELKYSMMRTGLRDGSRTVDVLLDRVVFGAPVTSYDLWRKMHLHETSRQHSEHCGIDVIVAGSGLNAEQAAQALVELAKKHYPDSPLAQISDWKDSAFLQVARVSGLTARHSGQSQPR